MLDYVWPEIFVNPSECDPSKEHRRELAVAQALEGWALCMAGANIPEQFGWGMIKLAEWAGVNVLTADVASKLAEEMKNAKRSS